MGGRLIGVVGGLGVVLRWDCCRRNIYSYMGQIDHGLGRLDPSFAVMS